MQQATLVVPKRLADSLRGVSAMNVGRIVLGMVAKAATIPQVKSRLPEVVLQALAPDSKPRGRPLPVVVNAPTPVEVEQPKSVEPNLLWTWATRNRKTGGVLTAFVGPTRKEAIGSCTGCPLLGGDCYAHASGQLAGAENVYINAAEDPAHYTLDSALARLRKRWKRVARLTGLGDLARVARPTVLGAITKLRSLEYAVLAYTHFWKDPTNADLKAQVMASCNDLVEADQALVAGWRPAAILAAGFEGKTFTTPGGAKGLVCPQQTGRAANCAECRLCDTEHPVWRAGKVQLIGFVQHGRPRSGRVKAQPNDSDRRSA